MDDIKFKPWVPEVLHPKFLELLQPPPFSCSETSTGIINESQEAVCRRELLMYILRQENSAYAFHKLEKYKDDDIVWLFRVASEGAREFCDKPPIQLSVYRKRLEDIAKWACWIRENLEFLKNTTVDLPSELKHPSTLLEVKESKDANDYPFLRPQQISMNEFMRKLEEVALAEAKRGPGYGIEMIRYANDCKKIGNGIYERQMLALKLSNFMKQVFGKYHDEVVSDIATIIVDKKIEGASVNTYDVIAVRKKFSDDIFRFGKLRFL